MFLKEDRYESIRFISILEIGLEWKFLYVLQQSDYLEKIDFGQLRCLVVNRLQYFVSIRNAPSWLQVLPFFQHEFE